MERVMVAVGYIAVGVTIALLLLIAAVGAWRLVTGGGMWAAAQFLLGAVPVAVAFILARWRRQDERDEDA